MVGAAPPPSITMVGYFDSYHADTLKDDNKDDLKVFDDVSSGRLSCRASGSLILVTWHTVQGELHMVLDLADIYIPFHNEDDENPASVGRNFWTIEPVFTMTWLPTPDLEFSAKFMYDFNTRQDDFTLPGPSVTVDRTPGQEFHVDFNTSYAILPNLRIGIGGYYYRQVTYDGFHDIGRFLAPLRRIIEYMEYDHSQVAGFSPGIWYQHKNIMASLRTQWEPAAKN